jgi:hypothetical protein
MTRLEIRTAKTSIYSRFFGQDGAVKSKQRRNKVRKEGKPPYHAARKLGRVGELLLPDLVVEPLLFSKIMSLLKFRRIPRKLHAKNLRSIDF